MPVVGYEKRYEVSDDGRVRNNGKRKGGEIRPTKNRAMHNQNGYPCLTLYKGAKGKLFYVHRLVLEAFVSHRPKGMECNHKNGIKTDNRLKNLEWCTRSENLKHAFRIGLAKPTSGCFKKNGKPWNDGKKTGQKPWNYIEDRSCNTQGCNGEYFCRGMCEKCHRRSRFLKENNLLPHS